MTARKPAQIDPEDDDEPVGDHDPEIDHEPEAEPEGDGDNAPGEDEPVEIQL